MKIENNKLIYDNVEILDENITYKEINKIVSELLENNEITNDNSSLFLTKIIDTIKEECENSSGSENEF